MKMLLLMKMIRKDEQKRIEIGMKMKKVEIRRSG